MGLRIYRCLFSSLLRHPIFFVTLPLLLLTYCVRIITSESKVSVLSCYRYFHLVYFITHWLIQLKSENVYYRFPPSDQPPCWADPAT